MGGCSDAVQNFVPAATGSTRKARATTPVPSRPFILENDPGPAGASF